MLDQTLNMFCSCSNTEGMDLNLVFMGFVRDGNQFLWHTYYQLMYAHILPINALLNVYLGFFKDKPMSILNKNF